MSLEGGFGYLSENILERYPVFHTKSLSSLAVFEISVSIARREWGADLSSVMQQLNLQSCSRERNKSSFNISDVDCFHSIFPTLRSR